MTEDHEDERLERIRERAYELWEEEGCPQGRDDIHWRRAAEEFDAAAKEQSPVAATGPAEPVPETAENQPPAASVKRGPGNKARRTSR